MTGEMDQEEAEAAILELKQVPGYLLFEISNEDGEVACVFGPPSKRNWVMWRLSKYVIAASKDGPVSVRRHINGDWHPADDWKNLGN